MPPYWDPTWAKPSRVVTGPVNADALVAGFREVEALMPKELRQWTPCPSRPGITRDAVAGPDYSLLVPAALRDETADLQRRIGRLTWYLICTRPSISLVPEECYIADQRLRLGFALSLDGGEVKTVTTVAPERTDADTVEVTRGGARLVLTTADGRRTEADASMLAQGTITAERYEPSVLDLEVRYIGRARGPLATKCALDRLASHDQYQAILEEISAYPFKNREIVLMLCAGTTFHISSAGDHPPSSAEIERERAAVDRIRGQLSEQVRVDAVEALLINLFKPAHNKHYAGDLDPRWDSFHKCFKAGLTSVTLVLSTDTLRCGLYTATQPAAQHFVHTVCL